MAMIAARTVTLHLDQKVFCVCWYCDPLYMSFFVKQVWCIGLHHQALSHRCYFPLHIRLQAIRSIRLVLRLTFMLEFHMASLPERACMIDNFMLWDTSDLMHNVFHYYHINHWASVGKPDFLYTHTHTHTPVHRSADIYVPVMVINW
jgi:hypothetical protein